MGDMILEVTRSSGISAFSSGFHFYDARPWPNGVLPIEFGPEITPKMQSEFFEHCAKWSRIAKVSCVARSTMRARPSKYLRVLTDPYRTCFSHVGMRRLGRVSEMNMHGCWTPGQLTHEIGHAFGLIHEHQRSDRDRYVRIDLTKVLPEYAYAYDRIKTSRQNGPYDFESIMHYPATAYAARPGDRVMTPQPGFESHAQTMGMTAFTTALPTELDGRALAEIYGTP
jgi:hypothetical protein